MVLREFQLRKRNGLVGCCGGTGGTGSSGRAASGYHHPLIHSIHHQRHLTRSFPRFHMQGEGEASSDCQLFRRLRGLEKISTLPLSCDISRVSRWT